MVNTLSFNKEKLTAGNEYDYITRTSLNQGILQGTGFVNKSNLNEANVWSLGLLQMDFFYRKRKWYAGQFVRKIIPKFDTTANNVKFFSTVLNKLKPVLLQVLIRNVDDTFRKQLLTLPSKNGKIDFDFMETFVAELEAQRVAELEAQRVAELQNYLEVSGLDDYELSNREIEVLKSYDSVEWGEYRIGDLFEKVKVRPLKYKTSELKKIPDEVYKLPALTAGIENQGLNNYVPIDNATILRNVISISANGANTGVTFFQSNEFTVLQDAYAIDWKDPSIEFNRNNGVFISSVINGVLHGKYEWTNKAGWLRVQDEKIYLPSKNNQIDFDFMETYISAITKLAIKDVVKYADKRIAATKKIVNKQ